MSELHAGTGPARPAVSAVVALWTDIFQAAMLICVVGWVLDFPRRMLGISLYTEQLLAVCLGLALAISFINGKFPQRWMGWGAAFAALAICGYITARYEALTTEIAELPAEGVAGSVLLIALVLEATRRTAGGVLVAIILIISAYVFIGPHMPGDFATRAVSWQRLVVYYGLDVTA